MNEKDQHFWIKDVANRLPTEFLPKTRSWSALLTAITQLKAERNNAMARCADLEVKNERLTRELIKQAIKCDNMTSKRLDTQDMWFQLVGNTTEQDSFGNIVMQECDFNAINKFIRDEL
mgnify:CR=1 FL=1